jgi:preprotein translocase subunit SecD
VRSLIGSVLALLLVAAGTLACDPPAESLLVPSIVARHAYTLCPRAGATPSNEVTDAAIEVLSSRLTTLGVDSVEITAGACLEVDAATSVDEGDVRAAVLGTGRFELVPVPPDQAEDWVPGVQPPEVVAPMASGSDFTSGGVVDDGGPQRIEFSLSPAGATSLGNWSQGNVGAPLALVLDGVVVGVPFVNEPILDGQVTMSLPNITSVPLAAIGAMLESGPLPEEWSQPQRPQG